jgi:hypothetical protein
MSIKTASLRAVNSILSAITPNPWAGKAWGTDVYEGAVHLNLPPGSVDFVVIRMGGTKGRDIFLDESFPAKVQAAWDAGAIPMAYWVVDSSYYPLHEWTVGSFQNMTPDKNPVHVAITDALRAGNSWKKVGALFYDCELSGAGDVWDALYVEKLRDCQVDLSKTGKFPPGIKLGIYSRLSWIEGRPALKTLAENQAGMIIWTANYMTAYPGKAMPIADYKTKGLPLTTQKPIWFGDNKNKPKTYPRIWQYHGTFPGAQYSTCPEITDADGDPSGLDLNVFEGTRAELFAMVGWADPLLSPKPYPEPLPDPDPVDDHAAILARISTLEKMLADHEGELTAIQTRMDRHIAE